MESICMQRIIRNLREELWSYFALSGLLFLNIGIVLLVFALKRATSHHTVVELFGVGLITMGVIATLASWYFHRKHRRRKPLCSCCFICLHMRPITDDTSEASKDEFKDFSTSLSNRDSDGGRVSPRVSKIEFQTYAEYVKNDTLAGQQDLSRKDIVGFKVETRYKKHVASRRSAEVRQTAMFTNAGFARETSAIPQPVTATNSLLEATASVSPIVLQVASLNPNLLQPVIST